METVEYRPSRDQLVYTFGGAAPVLRIKPGTALNLWSEDAFNNALTSVEDLSSEKVDLNFVNPQTGPFYVEGAEPGDTLVLHIVDLSPARSYGASATIPFFGGLTSTDRTAFCRIRCPTPPGFTTLTPYGRRWDSRPASETSTLRFLLNRCSAPWA
ncbi:acetamidase/formamidase family protein [Arthrobacter sp. ATA002]|uniref:acetamidase/formamidase family protein n=1 Tax=Arthrobacter sp. ATA002 TaxID=2991715 RepID=UPI0022A75457|nr:acetamidase/formamidase family protein [Arthrobacter sp. ATA002]WAP52150.1 acetamidase/formamidase family protein [Arthrobacter sp. ATA002]